MSIPALQGLITPSNIWHFDASQRTIKTFLTQLKSPTILVAASNAPIYIKRMAHLVCDGTDDQEEIHAALDMLPTLGGTVALSQGGFTVTRAGDEAYCVLLKARAKLLGQGQRSSVITAADGVAHNIAVINADFEDVEIGHLEINGNTAGRPGDYDTQGEGIDAGSGALRLNIHDVYVHNCPSEGIDCDGVSRLRIHKAIVVDCGGNGIHVSDNNAKESTVSDCVTSGNGKVRRDASTARHGGFVLRGDGVVCNNCVSIDDSRPLNCEPTTDGTVQVSNFYGRTGEPDVGGLGNLLRYAGPQARVILSNVTLISTIASGSHFGIAPAGDTSLTINGGRIKSNTTTSVFYMGIGTPLTLNGVEVEAPNATNLVNLVGSTSAIALINGCSLLGAATNSVYSRNGYQLVMTGSRSDARVRLDSNNNIVSDNRLLGGILLSGGSENNKIYGNEGFVTENRGTATIADTNTSVAVTHGLAQTPSAQHISVTPTNGLGDAAKFWVSDAGATTFQINVDTDPGETGATFSWQARTS